ncbi:MAG: 50S ribosomal protein L22 [Deltaproteobacteria bacterium]|nr:50S ribosomal protein L22 [Deltaproteobacteria bacterium]
MSKRKTGNKAASETPAYKAAALRVRIAPRKARLVVDLIRGKNVVQALGILDATQKKASPIVKDVLKSAIANAEQKNPSGFEVDRLKVLRGWVNEAPVMKRYTARAFGRGALIKKRSCHITLFVG